MGSSSLRGYVSRASVFLGGLERSPKPPLAILPTDGSQYASLDGSSVLRTQIVR
ncbi:MAG: hypothetical protein ACLFQA_04555 [Bacteroidales bacterium]